MDPFRVLGLEPSLDVDRADVERRFRELQKVIHPDRHAQKGAGERRLTLERAVTVNEAYRVLSDDLQRVEAVLRARGVTLAEGASDTDPALLMEFMDLRERLEEARDARDPGALDALVVELRALRDASLAGMRAALGAPGECDGSALARLLGRLRYGHRLLAEAEDVRFDLGAHGGG